MKCQLCGHERRLHKCTDPQTEFTAYVCAECHFPGEYHEIVPAMRLVQMEQRHGERHIDRDAVLVCLRVPSGEPEDYGEWELRKTGAGNRTLR